MLLQPRKRGSERLGDLSKVTQKAIRVPRAAQWTTPRVPLGVPPCPALDGKKVRPGGRRLKFSSGLQRLLTRFGQLPRADNSPPLCFRACKIAVRAPALSSMQGYPREQGDQVYSWHPVNHGTSGHRHPLSRHRYALRLPLMT